ncbi:uncharacterized protein LOC125229205 isoform X2 [Leguminivora glycinivorella]|uniref:uncharacterized protein LOC125229205 isoform X2 n=1 Tax=Leguminivora glycinivorella TaxID=1035111 RepID=UPI00200EEEAD|nr:uncharacterized protein LOC125229205 isoform X2 [Leguminivora glycinivorella]
MKAWTATEQDTSLPCCRTLHIKHAAYASALYTLNISILVVLLYSWRIGVNAKRYKELDDVYYGKRGVLGPVGGGLHDLHGIRSHGYGLLQHTKRSCEQTIRRYVQSRDILFNTKNSSKLPLHLVRASAVPPASSRRHLEGRRRH